MALYCTVPLGHTLLAPLATIRLTNILALPSAKHSGIESENSILWGA